MKRLFILGLLLVSFGGCAQVNSAIGIYRAATTTTVPAGDVVIAANAFDALKATATNYGYYCVTQHFPQPVCAAGNRRAVVKAVRAGTAARVQLEASLNTSQPAPATVYNVLIAAVNALKATPISTVKGS